MSDEYERLRLRGAWESYDRTIAALRRAIVDGKIKPFQMPGQLAWIAVNVTSLEQVRQRIAAKFPDDPYVGNPLSSQPPPEELVFQFTAVDGLIRELRGRLSNGLTQDFKRMFLPSLRRYLAEAENIAGTFRRLYPDSPHLAQCRLSSTPTMVEEDGVMADCTGSGESMPESR